jgi:flagellar biosynthesis/type III secretory pathway protein FliH
LTRAPPNKNRRKSPTAHWREFFKTGKAPDGAPEYIRKAADVVNHANLTKEERDIMTSAEWAEDKYQSGIQTAYEDGWDKGERTGFAKGERSGIDKGQLGITLDYIRDGDISMERASRRLGIPVSVIEEYLRKGLPQ